MITAEWTMKNFFYQKWAFPYEEAAKLYEGLGRAEEARDTARLALKQPWWTVQDLTRYFEIWISLPCMHLKRWEGLKTSATVTSLFGYCLDFCLRCHHYINRAMNEAMYGVQALLYLLFYFFFEADREGRSWRGRGWCEWEALFE
jgi:hypothetical protein